MKHLNSTLITLILKTKAPIDITHYELISCINVLYKIIAKLLVNWISHVLPNLISMNQFSFVKGCLLSDNSTLADEHLWSFDQKSTPKRACIVVDLQKAFDTVQWSTVCDVMRSVNFSHMFITLIHDCISTPKFSIIVKGQPSPEFKSGRWLHQGYLLLPILFNLVVEMLS